MDDVVAEVGGEDTGVAELRPGTGQVGAVLETLADEPEALLARVSGSGGTCFALCAGDIEAEGLAERLEVMAPHWWVRRCRLGGAWPDEG